MNLIVPTRFLGASVCAESTPLGDGLGAVFRGVDFDPVIFAALSRARGQPVPPEPAEPLPVIVRELGDDGGMSIDLFDRFWRAANARYALAGTPTGPADVTRWIAREERWAVPEPPPIAHPSTWPPLSEEGYSAVTSVEWPVAKRIPGRTLRRGPPPPILGRLRR